MSNTRFFGTDGMRGPFGQPPLDLETVFRLGLAVGRRLSTEAARPSVLLGGDTRDSTPEICRWLTAALESTGCSVVYAGVLPSPAVSRLVTAKGFDAGAAISASHNPHPDNGIKLIDSDGSKWGPEKEERLEHEMLSANAPAPPNLPDLRADDSLRETYLGLLTSDVIGTELATKRPLADLRVTLDSSNGAASGLAAELFTALGATVDTLGDRPDGRNINDGCGSTMPQAMASATTESGSHVGFAFDGDADRVVLADELGIVHDGDSILYLLGTRLHRNGLLTPPRIVATSMSNLGLEVALRGAGIEIVRCDVGDRIVVQTLKREGLLLGGEQSGHIIHLGLGATGDGLQTALLISRALIDDDTPLSQQLSGFRSFPQVLHNIKVSSKPNLLDLPSVKRAVEATEVALGNSGRLVLRYSGTEPLARIMIEGPTQTEVDRLATDLGAVIEAEIGTDQ